MLALLSPAKKQNFDSPAPVAEYSTIPFQAQAEQLVQLMQAYTPEDLKSLMGISHKLAELNVDRYLSYQADYDIERNSKQALFAFQGDVYRGLDAETLKSEAVKFAQDHIAILSGLYGLLRPLDLIQPHRLEMGTKLPSPQGQNLYDFWDNQITALINQRLASSKSPIVINLASQEYIKAIQPKRLKARFLTIDFKENRAGSYKTIGLFAKRARGMMARFVAVNQIMEPEDLKAFDYDEYCYNAALSTENKWVFSR